MLAPWIASNLRLPALGERIEFVLGDRDVALQGEYGTSGFQSHWSIYGLVRVVSWRSLGETAATIPHAVPVTRHVPDGHASSLDGMPMALPG